MNIHEYYIKECIKLAKKGIGYVSPNPLVGSVIVKNNQIIGKGFHKVFGQSHAEVNAIIDAKKNGYNLNGTSLYVNLEPCNHFGKTPPCTEAIIKDKIRNVIIGMNDPNKNVSGNGIKKLKESGINVTSGILEKECEELNKFFVKYITKSTPYVTLKIAQSIDAKIALNNFKSKWITNDESRIFVHKLRSRYDSVLIGKNTAIYDNPSLTVRGTKGRNPFRFVIDRKGSLPSDLNLYTDENFLNTYTFISSKYSELKKISAKEINKIFLKEINHNIPLKEILKSIFKLEIASILVEGGGNLFSRFINEDLFDDVYFIVAPKIIGKGISYSGDFELNRLSESKFLNLDKVITSNGDIILYYKNIKKGK